MNAVCSCKHSNNAGFPAVTGKPVNYSGYMKYKFKKELYSKTALLKAAYNFTDKAFVHLDADDYYYLVELEMKEGEQPVMEKEFTNEMVAQSVRHEIYLQTKNIRELMLARAMATTVIAQEDSEQFVSDETDEYSEDEILKDWFAEG